MQKVKVIGAGLAGVETAYYLANRGIKVELIDIKPNSFTPAHTDENFGELVCSNSLKSSDIYGNACGLLKEEMRILGSLTMESADRTAVPAGGALAVDRKAFAKYITDKIKSHKNIEVVSKEIEKIPDTDEYVVIATGPLTTDKLSIDIKEKLGGGLFFFDASAPIVSADSIDMDNAFYGDRYGKGTGDHINCPMNKEHMYTFDYFALSCYNSEAKLFLRRITYEKSRKIHRLLPADTGSAWLPACSKLCGVLCVRNCNERTGSSAWHYRCSRSGSVHVREDGRCRCVDDYYSSSYDIDIDCRCSLVS